MEKSGGITDLINKLQSASDVRLGCASPQILHGTIVESSTGRVAFDKFQELTEAPEALARRCDALKARQ